MSYKTQVEHAQRHREMIREVLRCLTDADLKDLVRRGQHRIGGDGHPRGGGGEVHGQAESTTTEAAALRLAAPADSDQPDTWEDTENDLIASALNDVFGLLAEMAGISKSVQRRLDFIEGVRGKARVPGEIAGHCAACTRPVTGVGNDRLRAGYCDACRKAWARAGFPDRFGFEKTRPQWQAPPSAATG